MGTITILYELNDGDFELRRKIQITIDIVGDCRKNYATSGYVYDWSLYETITLDGSVESQIIKEWDIIVDLWTYNYRNLIDSDENQLCGALSYQIDDVYYGFESEGEPEH